MYLLYADETNLDPTTQFFVYGGLAIPGEQTKALHDSMEHIRSSHAVPHDFILKFNPGPEHLSHQEFIALKQAVIEAAAQHQCLFFSDIILHQIASSPDEARRFSINRVAYHFDCYLTRVDGHGLVLIDRFSDSQIDAQPPLQLSVLLGVCL